MSRGTWIIVGVLLGVVLGVGLRKVDLALAPPEAVPPPEDPVLLNPTPFVHLRTGGVWLDGVLVATPEDLRAERRLAPLTGKLSARRRAFRTQNPGLPFSGALSVCAAGGTRFAALRRVLSACRLAGYDHVDLGALLTDLSPKGAAAVRSGDCSRLDVSTRPAPRPRPPGPNVRPEEMFRIEVLLGGEGIVIQAGGLRRVLPAKGGRLRHELREIKMRIPNKDDLAVSAEDDLRQHDLMRGLAACHKAGFTALSLDLRRAGGELLGASPGGSTAVSPGTLAGGGQADAGPRGQSSLRGGAPRVLLGRPEIRGPLSREIVRRIVRQHVNEVSYCYQKALQKDPTRAGRVVLRFKIDPSGQVTRSAVQSSTLGSPEVEACVAGAARRWIFPKPRGGGAVLVSYPVLLRAR